VNQIKNKIGNGKCDVRHFYLSSIYTTWPNNCKIYWRKPNVKWTGSNLSANVSS